MGYWEGKEENGIGRNGGLEDKGLNLRDPVRDYFINYTYIQYRFLTQSSLNINDTFSTEKVLQGTHI